MIGDQFVYSKCLDSSSLQFGRELGNYLQPSVRLESHLQHPDQIVLVPSRWKSHCLQKQLVLDFQLNLPIKFPPSNSDSSQNESQLISIVQYISFEGGCHKRSAISQTRAIYLSIVSYGGLMGESRKILVTLVFQAEYICHLIPALYWRSQSHSFFFTLPSLLIPFPHPYFNL